MTIVRRKEDGTFWTPWRQKYQGQVFRLACLYDWGGFGIAKPLKGRGNTEEEWHVNDPSLYDFVNQKDPCFTDPNRAEFKALKRREHERGYQ
jgi:hypothetical protein